MKKLLFLSFMMMLTTLVTTNITAQTFNCQDITFSGSFSDTDKQAMKEKLLGTEMKLEFFDTTVKITATDEKSLVGVVLDEVDKNEYKTKKGSRDISLSLQKITGIIKNATLVVKEGNKTITFTYKREVF